VNGVPILDNILGGLQSAGIRRVIIVVGYLAEVIEVHARARFASLSLQFVTNSCYSTTGTSQSFLLGLCAVREHETVVLIEADVFCDHSILTRITDVGRMATAIAPFAPNLSGSFVLLDTEGEVSDWVHDQQRSEDFNLHTAFKTINVTIFDADGLRIAIKPALAEALRRFGESAPFEFAARIAVREFGAKIRGLVCQGIPWVEIDTLEDLQCAERMFPFAHGSQSM
jgi:choline kinase